MWLLPSESLQFTKGGRRSNELQMRQLRRRTVTCVKENLTDSALSSSRETQACGWAQKSGMAGDWRIVGLLFLHLLFPQTEQAVFLSPARANNVMARQKRARSYLIEEVFEGNLERECLEERCDYEEAREVFEDKATTDRFWSHYSGGRKCASNPCLNDGKCQDNSYGYICLCPEGYEGINCQHGSSKCHPLTRGGCQQFCYPGVRSFKCSCASGYTLGEDEKSCFPKEECACGILDQKGNKTVLETKEAHHEFLWQVKLMNSEGEEFCGGVILKKNFVLTTAECARTYENISVVSSNATVDPTPLDVHVQRIHEHMHYDRETGENNLALLELAEPIRCRGGRVPICIPENDFASYVLIPRMLGVVSGWTVDGNQLRDWTVGWAHSHLPHKECEREVNGTVTSRMFCVKARGLAAKPLVKGSIVATVDRKAWFLLGILNSPPAQEPGQSLLFTKVARYSLWFRKIMG
ncbi:vitamin K-dependent protein Z [Tachyglossus aculeatus]|uniref:vitamin K-dependent protein Z n=1 Tax=Tachyglossus aculeatus TaxID=9261 RepID=UPI0018F27A62|nr:vitamin K-dependent protein Z [Tachyglossus aculeatus]